MTVETLETDYLVIGAGAMGMAFTDTLLSETNARMVMVDRHHQPGGHWNNAYPFVRLHQPSAFYGVNSRPLGSDTIDATGWNKGLYELATGSEVLAYFDQVMQQQFLTSGRVQYFPMSRYEGDGTFVSLLSGEKRSVVARKLVDATYMNVSVPAVTPPKFQVADEVICVPPNALPTVADRARHVMVIGAGKTGMDACLFLLRHGADPDAISWVMPRDSWVLDRAMIQPEGELGTPINDLFARQMDAIAQSTSINDLFDRLHGEGALLRIHDTVAPTMYRCATVTTAELEQLRRIRHVIRMGRVQRIEPDAVLLDEGTIAARPDTLYVNCTADGLERRPAVPVFQGDRITLQAVRQCQQVFSAALIGHVEAAYDAEAHKNRLCTPVPHPDTDLDFLRVSLATFRNTAEWSQDPDLTLWLDGARLNGLSARLPLTTDDPEEQARIAQTLAAALTAVAKLERYVAEIDVP